MNAKISLLAAAALLTSIGCADANRKPRSPDAPDLVTGAGGGEDGAKPGSSSGDAKSGGTDPMAGSAPSGPPPVTAKGDAPGVSSLASFREGFRWGMNHAELTKMFTQTGGIIWKDYDKKLAHARVGPEMTALENEREQAKAAFGRSHIEFKDTPTGYDATGIKGEYTYKNKESLMWVQRDGRKRYFFFINDRLWKIYDEVPLADGGPYGKAFLDAVNKVSAQVGVNGRVRGVDAEKGINATTVDWQDASSHLRVVDRSGEGLVGLVLEDNATLGNLASLRANKQADPTAVDPSIAAVTGGANRSDPNAAKGDEKDPKKPAGKKPAPKKK